MSDVWCPKCGRKLGSAWLHSERERILAAHAQKPCVALTLAEAHAAVRR